MERKEFEQVLKRALELQSLKQTSQENETFSNEDLQSAAARLGINDDILEQALKDTLRQQKKFHLSGAPEEIREAFLKHFLMNESIVNPGHTVVKIDHDSIKSQPGGTIRVYHPISKEVDAYIEFSAAPEGGTNVSWTGNNILPLRTRLLIFSSPLLILVPLMGALINQGDNLLKLLPIAIIFFMTSGLMQWGIQNGANGLGRSLENYFQNCQTIDEIENQKKLKTELENLRSSQKQSSQQEALLRKPIMELHEPESADPDQNPDETVQKAPHQPDSN